MTHTERLAWISQVKPQWLLEAKIKTYKLYDHSFLSLIRNSGWVADEVANYAQNQLSLKHYFSLLLDNFCLPACIQANNLVSGYF